MMILLLLPKSYPHTQKWPKFAELAELDLPPKKGNPSTSDRETSVASFLLDL